ncbi:MAG: CHASE2 domain-containing protein, partial [Smithellaceae bacterium]|nr:CHASE2 domain-containing protein [Smithellaceae bacterium]
MNNVRKWLFSDIAVGAVLTVLILAAFLWQWRPLEDMEYRIYDLGLSLRQESVKSPPVAIVAIDDESIANIGRWPWPRGHIAQMIGYLSGCGAKVIGVDILYSEAD